MDPERGSMDSSRSITDRKKHERSGTMRRAYSHADHAHGGNAGGGNSLEVLVAHLLRAGVPEAQSVATALRNEGFDTAEDLMELEEEDLWRVLKACVFVVLLFMIQLLIGA